MRACKVGNQNIFKKKHMIMKYGKLYLKIALKRRKGGFNNDNLIIYKINLIYNTTLPPSIHACHLNKPTYTISFSISVPN